MGEQTWTPSSLSPILTLHILTNYNRRAFVRHYPVTCKRSYNRSCKAFWWNDEAAVLSWRPIIQHICFWLQTCHRAFARGEQAINQWTGSTYKKRPRQALPSETDPYLIFPPFSCRWREIWETKTSLLSRHCSYSPDSLMWLHCQPSESAGVVIFLVSGRMWGGWRNSVPGHRCGIHISVVWDYIF